VETVHPSQFLHRLLKDMSSKYFAVKKVERLILPQAGPVVVVVEPLFTIKLQASSSLLPVVVVVPQKAMECPIPMFSTGLMQAPTT
jgi:hypothetical protein